MKKRIAMLYDSPEWSQQEFIRQFQARKIHADLYDIEGLDDVSHFGSYMLVLNRVYPSAPDRGKAHLIPKALAIFRKLDEMGVHVVNCMQATVADFSKFRSYEMMRDAGVPTPKTHRVEGFSSIARFIDEVGLPIVFKNDTGGRTVSVTKANTLEAARRELERRGRTPCYGGLVVQEFIRPRTRHSTRITMTEKGEVMFPHRRTLVPRELEGESVSDFWMYDRARGSEIEEYAPTREEVKIAIAANLAIGAEINSLDMHTDPDGRVYVIENNPTVDFGAGNPRASVKIAGLLDYLLAKYRIA